MQLIGYGKEYLRQAQPKHSRLQQDDRELCFAAIPKFTENPRNRGLNFERLGNGAQNHWSIRASKELRVILAADPPVEPGKFAPVNMGHHDQMYAWSERQGFHTNLADSTAVYRQDGPANANPAIPPLSFEEWMLFLPQEQQRLTSRYHSGAARIRGAAGTGKTVIALHRAAELGRRYAPKRILFTTYSRSLCTQMQELFQRLPNAPRNVDFRNIDRVAWDTLKSAKRLPDKTDFNKNPQKIAEAFEAAYRRVVPGTSLERIGRDYIRDEIERVIKGRAAAESEYLDTGRFERRGRMQSLKKRDREICWRLCEVWDREMKTRGAVYFPNLLIQARNLVQERQEGFWRAAVVDEAQDMTLVGVQLVRALVAGAPRNAVPRDGILMLDDAAQRIYAGGFKPAWAKLDFTGRSEILRKNYRNGRAIFEASRAVRGDTLVVKEDNDDGAAALDVKFERSKGARPIFLAVRPRGESPAIADRVRNLVEEEDFELQEIGVLTRRRRDADQFIRYLNKYLKQKLNKAHPCVNLQSLREQALGPGVRVGTFDRAKGLEFRAVFIPRLGKSHFPRDAAERDGAANATPSQSSEEEKEARLLQLTRLYVAMTRAKDRLYLLADEEPCQEIDAARDYFDSRDPPPYA